MRKIIAASLVAVYVATACTSENSSAVDDAIAIGGQTSTYQEVETTTGCNDEISAFGEPVHDAIDKTTILLLDYWHRLGDSGYDPAARQIQNSISHELTQTWNLIAVDSGKQLGRRLTRASGSLRLLIDVHPGNTEALIAANSHVATSYEELAGEFEKCVTTRDVADRLREYSLAFQQTADGLRQGM